ncbi:hypothetical protein ROS1_59000 [Roseibium sp. ROS1]
MKLKHACSLYGDYGLNISADEYVDDGIPLIRTSDFDDLGRLHLSDPKLVDETTASKKLLRRGDILFSRAGTIGRCTTFDRNEPATFAAYLVRFRPISSKVEPRFIGWWAQSEQYWDQVRVDTIESTIGNFNATKLGNLSLPKIDVRTQKTIAKFLDHETARIDELIEKKQRLVEVLPEKEKGEISRLVLRGANPSAPLRDTGIFWRGDVPEHWTESRLKAHFRIQKRQGFDDLTVLSVYREYGVIEKSSRDDNINKTPEDLSKYQLVEPGDLVINKMKSWQGSLGVSTFKGITSPDYVVMTPFGDHHPQYMHHLLRAVPMPTVYHLISNGIRIDQWRMEPDRFLSLPVFLPPMGEQKQIAQRVEEELERLRNVAHAINKSISRLREYRAALITAAVTGQIDVTTWGKQGQTDHALERIEADLNPAANERAPISRNRSQARRLVAAEIVYSHRNIARFGRIKLHKIMYLAETHANLNEIEGCYRRHAAGPYDEAMIQDVETGLRQDQFYDAVEDTSSDHGQIVFEPLKNVGQHRPELEKVVGDRLTEFRRLIGLLADFSTEDTEAIVTLYAVWNDALLDGETPDDARIIRGFRQEWHDAKLRFTEEKLRIWLGWMRRNDLVPRGAGPHTISTHQPRLFD